MTDLKLLKEVPPETWATVAPELSLIQLNDLERGGINIQCLNSSDFVVGRQTNFNGPVTIINCTDVLRQRNHEGKCEGKEEEVVIREKVLSQSAAIKVQKLATEEPEEDGHQNQDMLKGDSRFKKLKKSFRAFALIFVGLFLVASVALTVLPTGSTENSLPRCTLLPNNYCIFSEFDWGGRRTSGPLKPLQTPVSHVIISQTYEDFCFEIITCLNVVHWLQLNRTEETACSFLVGGDGNSYEDRGWDWESSLVGPVAAKALKICFMGDFSVEEYPTYPQIDTVKVLIRLGVDNDWISRDYVLAALNASSPQNGLGSIYKIIKKWPNFSEDSFSNLSLISENVPERDGVELSIEQMQFNANKKKNRLR